MKIMSTDVANAIVSLMERAIVALDNSILENPNAPAECRVDGYYDMGTEPQRAALHRVISGTGWIWKACYPEWSAQQGWALAIIREDAGPDFEIQEAIGKRAPAEAEGPEAEGSGGCSFAEQADIVATLKERWKQGIQWTSPIIDPIPGWDINAQVFLIREWEGISGFVSDVGYKYDGGVYTLNVNRSRQK